MLPQADGHCFGDSKTVDSGSLLNYYNAMDAGNQQSQTGSTSILDVLLPAILESV